MPPKQLKHHKESDFLWKALFYAFWGVPLTVLLFFFVLIFPAISITLAGEAHTLVIWDVVFGIFWFLGDLYYGNIHGWIAGVGFFIWPLALSFLFWCLVITLWRKVNSKKRIVLCILILGTFLVLGPTHYSIDQKLPSWNRYQFVTF